MKEHLDISSLLKESAEQHLVTTPDESWNVIKERLHQKRKRRIAYWWFAGVVTVAITSGLFLLKSQNNKEQIASTEKRQQKPVESTRTEQLSKSTENSLPNNRDITDEVAKNKTYSTNTDAQSSSNNKLNNNTLIKTQTNLFNQVNKTNGSEERFKKDKIRKVTTEPQEIELVNETVLITSPEITETTLNNTYVEKTAATEENTQTADSLQADSKKNQAIIKDVVTSKTASTNQQSKWRAAVQFDVNKVFVSDQSIFSALEKNMNTQTSSSFTTDNIRGVSVPSFYEKAFSLKAAVLFNKPSSKKINFHYGISLQYFQYSTNVFNAPWADIRVVGNSLTTNPVGNSFNNSSFTAVPNYLTTIVKYQVENHAVLLGGVMGAVTDIKKISKNSSLKLQTQLTPSVFLDQKLYWFNNANNRFFEDKSLTRKLLLQQNISVLLQAKINKMALTIGPSVQWNWNNANKKTIGLNNLNWTSIGLQTQIKF
jgi:hypothetical protein